MSTSDYLLLEFQYTQPKFGWDIGYTALNFRKNNYIHFLVYGNLIWL